MKASKILLLASVGLCVASLAGCGKKNGNAIAQEGRLSITYYPGGYGTEYLDYFCQHFLAEKKGVNPSDIVPGVDYILDGDPDITYMWSTKIESPSTCPDLIISNSMSAQAVSRGLVANLESVYNTEVSTSKGNRKIRDFVMKEAKEQYTYDFKGAGKFSFAMPWTAIPISIAYNNTILQKIPHVSSIPVGEDALTNGKWSRAPKTVTELKAIFEDAGNYDSNLTKFGFSISKDGANWFESLITTWWAQKQGIDTEYSYTGEGSYYDFWEYKNEEIFKQTGIQDALATIKDLFVKDNKFVNSFPSVNSITVKQSQQAFAEGKALFCLTGDFFEKEYGSFIEQSQQDFRMMRVPAIDGAVTKDDGVTPVDLSYINISSCAYVPNKGANKDLAKEFLTYTSSEENCKKMSEMIGAIRPFDYDARNVNGYSGLSAFTKSVFNLFYDADDYLVKFPRNVETSKISPVYLFENVSENIFYAVQYGDVVSSLLNYTPKQIMVDGTNIDSVYNSMKINFDRWRSDYPEINE